MLNTDVRLSIMLVTVFIMKNRSLILMSAIAFLCITALACGGRSVSSGSDRNENTGSLLLSSALSDTISEIVSSSPGEVGVAVIINGTDTIAVNDMSIYPMMSVFKMHQAIAICDNLDHTGGSLDSVISVMRDSLDQKTWSPMLKEHTESVMSVSVRDMLRYALIQSDNNASNLLFKIMLDVTATDSLIATLIPRSAFQIACTEEEMSADHAKAYSNFTSPLGAAMLIDRLFTDSVVSDEKQAFIKSALCECITGKDRIAAPLLGKEGVTVAHKTGSGYSANGILAAHNDVAYVKLPNGICYSLAVFVKDFRGDETEASEVIAHISAAVYGVLSAVR